MESVRNKLTFHHARPSKKGPTTRYMGIEMEISDFNRAFEPELKQVINKWKAEVVHDGSVEGTNCFEIRTAPARGSKFISQISEICGVLAKGKAKANRTCGLHVHVDCRDFTPNDLIKIGIVWPKVEKRFWNQTTEDRVDGEYCTGWNDCNEGIRNTDTTRQGNSLMDMYEQINDMRQNGDRYISLNLTSLNDLGTIENRMHHGTVSAKKIISWAKMNEKLMNYVKETPIEDVLKFNKPESIVKSKRTKPLKAKPNPDNYDNDW